MFTIWIDENGYYSTEDKGFLAEVIDMPDVDNIKHLLAYKYNSETQLLELDEEKLKEIEVQASNEHKIPTTEERLKDLENAFLELSTMILGGE